MTVHCHVRSLRCQLSSFGSNYINCYYSKLRSAITCYSRVQFSHRLFGHYRTLMTLLVEGRANEVFKRMSCFNVLCYFVYTMKI